MALVGGGQKIFIFRVDGARGCNFLGKGWYYSAYYDAGPSGWGRGGSLRWSGEHALRHGGASFTWEMGKINKIGLHREGTPPVFCPLWETLNPELFQSFPKSKVLVVYKKRLNKVNNGPYNVVILSLLNANMNLEYVTDIYVMQTFNIISW